MAQREVKQWITINGVHVPIFEGESKEDAVNRAIAKKNEDKKQSDIAKHSAQVKEANERQQAAKQPTKEQVKAFSKNPNKVVKDADKKLGNTLDARDKETGMLKSTKAKIDKMSADELDQEIKSNAAYIDRVKQKLIKDGKDENLEKTLRNHQRWQDYLQKRRSELGGDETFYASYYTVDKDGKRSATKYAKVTAGKDDMRAVAEHLKANTDGIRGLAVGRIADAPENVKYDSEVNLVSKAKAGTTDNIHHDNIKSMMSDLNSDVKSKTIGQNAVSWSARVSDGPLDTEQKKQVAGDIKSTLAAKYPDQDFKVSINKKKDGSWVKIDKVAKTNANKLSPEADKMVDMIKDSYIATYGKAKWDSLTDQQKHDAVMFIAKDLNARLDNNHKKSNTLFKFDWDKLPGTATANGEMVKYLKKNNIDYFYNQYFDLVADVDGDGNYYKLDHKGNGVVGIDRDRKYKKSGNK